MSPFGLRRVSVYGHPESMPTQDTNFLLSAALVSLKTNPHADDVAFLSPALLVATDAPVRYVASADYGIFALPLPRGEGHHQGPEANDTR